MDITIYMETDNAAFQDEGDATEVARILRKLADRIESGGLGDFALKDINGNTVGSMNVIGE